LVDQLANPLYSQLLEEIRARRGLGVVLNTSFNINEPIVCSPDDALRTFASSGIDALAIGPYLVQQR
ncbi:MAG: carbamoyltransferase C-terminal domain-containing protein, partial [Pseudomonadota bacterium]